MRCTKLMFLLALVSATLSAADPFAGTWKMNAAKSKYKTGPAPKEQTLTITEAGSDLNVKITGISGDGSKIDYAYTVPAAGGAGKLTGTTAWDSVSSKRVSPTEREINFSKGGKVTYTAHSKLSPDGKSVAVAAKGTNAQGKAIEGDVVFDKQ